jgi:hypothetical protein
MWNPSLEIIRAGLARYADNPKIRMKYGWLARYFNSVLAEFPQSQLKPIDLLSGD